MKEEKISSKPNTSTYHNGKEAKCHEPKTIKKRNKSNLRIKEEKNKDHYLKK